MCATTHLKVQAERQQEQPGRGSGFTYEEPYRLYDEQLHYARATYTTEQLDRWQTDWNRYFVQYGMEIPVYAHQVGEATRHRQPPAAEANGRSLVA